MMRLVFEGVEDLRSFVEAGGPVLWVIFVVILLMWAVIIERLVFGWRQYPRLVREALAQWQARQERVSWNALQIRQQLLSEISQQMRRGLHMLKILIAVCPLLGLLGTIIGMIEVFNILSLVGSGNTRAMAAGIFMATIPTMAGMVGSISGIYFSARLDRKVREKLLLLGDELKSERGEVCAAS